MRGARSVTKSQGSERGGEMGWGQGDLSKQVPSGGVGRRFGCKVREGARAVV